MREPNASLNYFRLIIHSRDSILRVIALAIKRRNDRRKNFFSTICLGLFDSILRSKNSPLHTTVLVKKDPTISHKLFESILHSNNSISKGTVSVMEPQGISFNLFASILHSKDSIFRVMVLTSEKSNIFSNVFDYNFTLRVLCLVGNFSNIFFFFFCRVICSILF
jgi:hypothetical protein